MVEVERVGWYSIGINCFLTFLNLTIALASGSLAVAAEMIHNYVLADAGVTASTSNSNDLEATLKEWREEVTSSQS